MLVTLSVPPNRYLPIPLAKKNEQTMSQMTSLFVDIKAWENVRVPVATVTVMARKAHAPTGSGSRTRPRTVDTKMANKDQP